MSSIPDSDSRAILLAQLSALTHPTVSDQVALVKDAPTDLTTEPDQTILDVHAELVPDHPPLLQGTVEPKPPSTYDVCQFGDLRFFRFYFEDVAETTFPTIDPSPTHRHSKASLALLGMGALTAAAIGGLIISDAIKQSPQTSSKPLPTTANHQQQPTNQLVQPKPTGPEVMTLSMAPSQASRSIISKAPKLPLRPQAVLSGLATAHSLSLIPIDTLSSTASLPIIAPPIAQSSSNLQSAYTLPLLR